MPCAPLLAAAGLRLRGSFSCLAGSAGLAAFFGGISCTTRRMRGKHEMLDQCWTGLTSCYQAGLIIPQAFVAQLEDPVFA